MGKKHQSTSYQSITNFTCDQIKIVFFNCLKNQKFIQILLMNLENKIELNMNSWTKINDYLDLIKQLYCCLELQIHF